MLPPMRSAFDKPSSVGQKKPTQAEQIANGEAPNLIALLNLILNLQREQGGSGLTIGRTITQTGPWDITEPITIPADCGGLRIVNAARWPIRVRGLLSSVFTVKAPSVTLQSLIVPGKLTSYATTFATLRLSNDATKVPPEKLRMYGCEVSCDRLMVEASGDSWRGGFIEDNIVTGINASHLPCIFANSSRTVLRGNILSSGGGNTVELATGSEHWAVSDNYFDGEGTALGFGGILTSGGNGKHTIVGNRRIGVMTLSAGANADVIAGNNFR